MRPVKCAEDSLTEQQYLICPALAVETPEQQREYDAALKRRQIRKQRRKEGF